MLLSAESVSFAFFKSSFFNILSYAIIFLLICGRLKRFAYVATRDLLFLAFILFASASIFWSASPLDTFLHIRAAARSILFGVYLAMQYTPMQIIKILSIVVRIVIYLCFFICLLIPSISTNTEGIWLGIFTHKQVIGRFMSFAFSVLIIQYINTNKSDFKSIFTLAITILLIFLSQSKTALIALLFLLFVIPFFKIVKQKNARPLLTLISILLIGIVGMIISLNIETIVVDYLGKNLEFNGRIPVWTMAISEGFKRPFFGYGYNGFWTSDFSSIVLNNTWAGLNAKFSNRIVIFHAHNGFIDIFLQLGIIGLLMFIINLFTTIIRVLKLLILSRKIEFFWMFAFLSIYIIFNLVEGETILSTSNILWISYIFIVISSKLEINHLKCKNKVLSIR